MSRNGFASGFCCGAYKSEVLCEYLKTPLESSCKGVHNVWQTAIWAFNNEVEGIDESRMLPYDLPMPDYRKLSNG